MTLALLLLGQVLEQLQQVGLQQQLIILLKIQILLEVLRRVKIQYLLGQPHLEQLQVGQLLQVKQLLVLLKQVQLLQALEQLLQVNLLHVALKPIRLLQQLLKQVAQQGLCMKQVRQHLAHTIQLEQQTLQLQRII